MKFLYIAIAFLSMTIIPELATAQSGTLQGRISDDNGLPMPGASVFLAERPSSGTSTDVNGRFTLVGIPPGSYTVQVTYIGYSTLRIPVTIQAGTNEPVEAELVESAVVGDDVVLIGDALRGQARALNQQRNNMNITNVVSADQVGRFPDENVGDALKRIPGITMQGDQGEARDIIIRGMAPQLNSVMLNGERIPSAEGDNRRVQLDLIPSDMIQSIEVHKAVLPDMDADAIGGSVNLVTRSAPREMRISATAGSGMNLLSNKPIWNGSLVAANRFLNDRLGAVFSASYHNHDFGSDNIEAEWVRLDNGDVVMGEFDIRKYLVRRERKSTSLGLDYRFNAENSIYLTGMYNWRDDWENRYRMRVSQIERAFDRNQAVATGNGTFALPARVQYQTKGGIDNDRVKMRRLEDQRNLNLTLGGDHLISNLKINWSATYARASEDRPNERYISYRSGGRDAVMDISNTRKPIIGLANPDENFSIGFHELSEENRKTFDRDFNSRIDFLLPYSSDGFLKFGARLRIKQKERDNNFFFYEPLNEDPFATLGLVPNSDQSDSGFLNGSRYQIGYFTTPRYLGGLDLRNPQLFEQVDGIEEYISGNYTADEQIYAGYLMGDHQLTSRLSMIAGLRLEYTSLDYLGYVFDIDEETFSSTTGNNSYLNVLPGLHLRYALSDYSIIRFAWTNTLARPNYYDLVPYAEFIREDDELARGNPDLKPTRAMNFDLMAEHYFSNVGILSAGVFYKDVNDFIYARTQRNYTDPVFGPGLDFATIANGGTADVYGFEVAVQRQIWRGLGIYLNYTRTESSTTGIEGRDDDIALPGTAKNMFNGSLSYETSRLSLRASLNYASDYIDELGDDAFEDRFYDKQTFVDLNGSYTITPKIRIFGEVKNLTNQPLRYYQGVASRMMQEEFYNVRFNFGLKVDLFN
ncbi:MAG: TonB-dependent receptor [Cyclonatronaceae bacterium]